MLTGRCLPYFTTCIHISLFFRALPYRYSSTTCQLKQLNHKELRQWKCVGFTMLLYCTFVIGRFVQCFQTSSVNVKILHSFWILLSLSGVVFSTCIQLKVREIQDAVNSLFQFELKIRRDPFYRHRIKDNGLFLELIFAANALVQILSPIIFPLVFWFMPDNPNFLASLVLPFFNENLRVFIKIPFYMFEYWIIGVIFGSGYFISSILILGPRCICSYIKMLKFIPKQKFDIIYEIWQQFSMLRQVQLILNLFIEGICQTILPILLAVGIPAIIISLYGSLKLFPLVGFPGYAMFPIFNFAAITVIVLVLENAGEIISHAKSIKRLWRNMKAMHNHKIKIIRSGARSFPIFKVPAGPFLTVTKNKSVVVIRFCMQRTFFLMVYFSRK